MIQMTAVVLLLCFGVQSSLNLWQRAMENEKVKTNSKIENAKIIFVIESNERTHATAAPLITASHISPHLYVLSLSIFCCVGLFGCRCHFCYKMPGMMKRKIIEMLLLRKFSKWNHIKTICIHFHHVIYIYIRSEQNSTNQATKQPTFRSNSSCWIPMFVSNVTAKTDLYTLRYKKIDIAAPSCARVFLLCFECWCLCWVSILIERKLMMMRQGKKQLVIERRS